jgi:hypothetical protein
MSYVKPKACPSCGEEFDSRINFFRHKQSCRATTDDLVAQLRNENARLIEQLKTKDEQINELIKRPQTTNHSTNNKWVVDASINIFGKESVDHITPEHYKKLLENPVSAVSELVKLKHKRANDNVRCPNIKRAMYQVVVPGEKEERQWENRARDEVLEELYETNAGILEIEADEDTAVGSKFLNFQEKVQKDESGKLYKEQLDKIHCIITSGHK